MGRELELAYLAGIIDGEGSICTHRRKMSNGRITHAPRVLIEMFAPAELDHLLYEYGARRGTRRSGGGKKVLNAYRWDYQDVRWMLKGVLPYLRIKRQQAELAIELAELRSTHHHPGKRLAPNGYFERQEEIAKEIRRLNQGG